MANIVAIVGRPNVGKSTFFNRLIGMRKAIMDNESGITRDRHYGYSDWNGKNFTVIDTGGYITDSDDIFEEAIREQVDLALDEATVILFMVNIDEGLTGLDQEFAQVLRSSQKPVYVVANKADNTERMHMYADFYGLGFEEVHPISAQSGAGTGELLDEVVKHFPENDPEDPNEGVPKIAIAGKPNVGKSSLTNLLLGKERSIVTDIAGTTRDAINSRYTLFGKDFLLVDTAGIRKKKNVREDVEFYSVLRSIQAIQECDVCIMMIDAKDGLQAQDLNILHIAQQANKGIVILVNKWDTVEKNTKTAIEYEKTLKAKLAPHVYIPIMFVSVIEKQRVFQAIELAMKVFENRTKRIPTSKLNDVLLTEIQKNPPPSLKGKYINIKYVTQLPTHTPTFAFYCNLPQYIKESYERFLENKIRANFDFTGVPIKIFFRKK